MLTEESLITKILYLILSPKIKRDIKKVKNSSEYMELERQAKLAAAELEAINKRMERSYESAKKAYEDAAKKGYKWKSSPEYMFK